MEIPIFGKTLFILRWGPGPWFNIKITSYQYRKSPCGDKTIFRPSYLHNGISYTGKTSIYWIWGQYLTTTKPNCVHISLKYPVPEISSWSSAGPDCWGNWWVSCSFSLNHMVSIKILNTNLWKMALSGVLMLLVIRNNDNVLLKNSINLPDTHD